MYDTNIMTYRFDCVQRQSRAGGKETCRYSIAILSLYALGIRDLRRPLDLIAISAYNAENACNCQNAMKKMR